MNTRLTIKSQHTVNELWTNEEI